MTTGHSQPNGRPVHPQCARLSNRTNECYCDELWLAWDGTREDLDRRIWGQTRAEERRRAGYAANEVFAPAREEWYADADADTGTVHADSLYDQTIEESGFWKDSEFLKTVDLDS